MRTSIITQRRITVFITQWTYISPSSSTNSLQWTWHCT